MATEQWTLRVPPKLDKLTRRAAARRELSLNAYVVWVLEAHLGAYEAEPSR
jgi:predicted HicB family RNase H-like nuclease